MSAIGDLRDAITGIVANWPIIRKFVNGGATETVVTGSGTLPVIAKVVADAQTTFEQAKTDLVAQKGSEIDEAANGVLAQTRAVAVDVQAMSDAAAESRAAAAGSAAQADGSAADALVAANASAASGRYFTSVALGLAGSADGQSFSTKSGDGQFLIVYQRQAGVAVEQLRFATQGYLDTGFDFSSYSRSGYVGAIVDSLKRIALGIRASGKIDIGNVQDVGGKVALNSSIATGPSSGASSTVATPAGAARTNPRLTVEVAALQAAPANVVLVQGRASYAWPWTDANDRVCGGLDFAGNLWTKGLNVTSILTSINTIGVGTLSAAAGLAANLQASAVYSRSGYALAFVDKNGSLAGGIASNGDLYTKGLNVTNLLANIGSNTPAITALQKAVYSGTAITCWGDSLTAGAGGTAGGYPPALAALLNRTVSKRAVGGQSSSDIATRQGGFSALLTVQGNVIPAAGPVAVTTWTRTPITSQGPGPIHGSLYGIPGTLSATFNANGTIATYTFTRDTAGVDTQIDPATPFIVDLGNEFDVTVFWYGRNNYPTGITDLVAAANNVKDALAASISLLAAAQKKFVILGVTNSDKAVEYKGQSVYSGIVQLNNDLKALYPRNFIDIRTILVRGYDPNQPQDVIDFNNDIPPSSLRSDPTHLNDAGYAIVAKAVANLITLKGW
ncbi:TPA: hypothetical protein QDB14_002956 [Burkholderia vietnamiensis]|nr:hypothetical protein [Burkholderia vietnamiensis]